MAESATVIPDYSEDTMYSFQFGGDITEYFGRYRRKLERRANIGKYPASRIGSGP